MRSKSFGHTCVLNNTTRSSFSRCVAARPSVFFAPRSLSCSCVATLASTLKRLSPLPSSFLSNQSVRAFRHGVRLPGASLRYEDGFDASSDVIRNFWSVVHEFDIEKQRALLKFVTGSDRAPIDGLAKMPFVISWNGPDSERLPTSHTCFNHLLLPAYPTREKMREKLLVAIDHTEGFGLR